MNWIDMQWPIVAGIITLSAILAVVITVLRRQQRRIQHLEKTLQTFQNNLDMASDSGIGVGRKVVSIERRLKVTEQKQKEFESTDPQKVSYNEAVRLISMGADVDDLVTSCGLTRAEANLLKTLHTSQVSSQLKNR